MNSYSISRPAWSSRCLLPKKPWAIFHLKLSSRDKTAVGNCSHFLLCFQLIELPVAEFHSKLVDPRKHIAIALLQWAWDPERGVSEICLRCESKKSTAGLLNWMCWNVQKHIHLKHWRVNKCPEQSGFFILATHISILKVVSSSIANL